MVTFTDLYYYANRLKAEIPYRFGNGYALPPVLALVELTYICNLRCDFCQFFQWQDSPKDWGPLDKELTTDEIKWLIDTTPGQLFSFTGGEVTVHPDCREILQYGADRRRIHFITNGVRIDEDFAHQLAAMGCPSTLQRGLFAFEVSIHGVDEVHDEIARYRGSYEKATAAIANVLEYRRQMGKKHPVVNVKMVITEKNFHQIAHLYEEMAKLGVDSFNVMAKQDIDAHYIRFKDEDTEVSAKKHRDQLRLDGDVLREQLQSLHRLSEKPGMPYIRYTPTRMDVEQMVDYYAGRLDLNQYTCYAPWTKVFVSSHGNIYSCPFKKIGNIREASVMDVWNSIESREFRKELRQETIFPGCLGCCNMERKLSAPAENAAIN